MSKYLSFAFLLSFLAACTSSSGGTATTNGVNDVVKACEIRAIWANATSSDCARCKGYSTTPRCPCADVDYAGKCAEQTTAKNDEPTCAGTIECVAKCKTDDCACVENCYAGKDACKKLAAAADGCVAEICDGMCK